VDEGGLLVVAGRTTVQFASCMRILHACLYWAFGPGKCFLNMGVHSMCSHRGTLTHQCFHSDITGMCLSLFTDWLQRHWTQQPWAWENVDLTKHQSGASSIAGCKSFQNHGMKLIWIVNVNFDSFLKFRQCCWNDLCVHHVYSVFLIFVVVCSTMLAAQTIHIQ
jgi:hypothetical protein